MVVTGFEIFGAVAAAIGLLNLARQGFDYIQKTRTEFQKIGPHMVEVQRECTSKTFCQPRNVRSRSCPIQFLHFVFLFPVVLTKADLGRIRFTFHQSVV